MPKTKANNGLVSGPAHNLLFSPPAAQKIEVKNYFYDIVII